MQMRSPPDRILHLCDESFTPRPRRQNSQIAILRRPNPQLLRSPRQCIHKAWEDRLLHIQQLDPDTYLSGIGESPESHTFHGSLKIAVAKHKTWILAAQFEHRRNQLLRGSHRDLAPILAAPRKED